MTQIKNPFFDELAKIMTNAAGAARNNGYFIVEVLHNSSLY